MIAKLEISGQHTEITPALTTYIQKKIGKLDRYIAPSARESVHAQVKLRENSDKDRQQCTCTVVLTLPHEVIEASETTINMFAAIDIVEARLQNQLRKYKEMHTDGKSRRHVFARFRRKQPVE